MLLNRGNYPITGDYRA